MLSNFICCKALEKVHIFYDNLLYKALQPSGPNVGGAQTPGLVSLYWDGQDTTWGYSISNLPGFELQGGLGSEATAQAVLAGYVTNVRVDNTGGGFNRPPTLTFSAPEVSGGTLATGTSHTRGPVMGISVVDCDPLYLGETDSNGFWIPKNPAISYSANGFKLEFQQTGASANASGFGADTSGNTNHFTIDNDDGDIAYGGGKTDTPTNNFNVLNPFAINRDKPIIGVSQGGLVPFDTQNDAHRIIGSIMCFAKGKWYMECKYSGGTNEVTFGILDVDNRYANQAWYTAGGSFPGDISDGNSFGYRQDGNLFTNGNTTSGKTTWASNGDFLGLAIDCDNNAIYAHVNGTYVDSGDPTSGASKTGSLSNFTQTGFMMPAVSVKATSYNGAYVNFGNPANDDSGVTNSNADANGYGKFQYAVPSGYFALCSKNLAEYG